MISKEEIIGRFRQIKFGLSAEEFRGRLKSFPNNPNDLSDIKVQTQKQGSEV